MIIWRVSRSVGNEKTKRVPIRSGSFRSCNIPWGVSSISKEVGTGKKKTGCRRRNVIKEDLVAQEDEVVESMVSSSLKGPYFSATNGFRRGLAMVRFKWFFKL